jgi:hypothetical protein
MTRMARPRRRRIILVACRQVSGPLSDEYTEIIVFICFYRIISYSINSLYIIVIHWCSLYVINIHYFFIIYDCSSFFNWPPLQLPSFSSLFPCFPSFFHDFPTSFRDMRHIKTKLGVLEFWHRDCFHCMGLGATQMLATGSKGASSTDESNHPGSLSAGSWPIVPCIYLIISYYNVLQYHLYIYVIPI